MKDITSSVNMSLKPVVVAMSAMLAVSAFAQSEKNSNDAKDDKGQLEQLVITAQKRVQNAQKTAMTINVVGGQDISDKALNTIDEVLKSAPGVEVQGLAQGAQIYIRGVGSSIDPTFADPAVALLVDGAYLGRTESAVSGTFDVERVEVLAGPQGTLYGRNASGGVVNVITANPKLGKNEGFIRQQFGNYGLTRTEGMYNKALGEDMALRVSGFREKHSGYVSDGSSDQDNYGVRAKLRMQPNAGLSITAKAEIYHQNVLGTNTVPAEGSAGNLTFPPPLMATNFDPAHANCGPSPFVGCAPIWRFPNGWTPGSTNPWLNDATHAPGYAKRDSESYALQVDADLGWSQLTVLPTYSRSKNVLSSSYLFGTLAGPSTYDPQKSDTVYESLEVRLASPTDSKTKWVVGGYLMKMPKGGLMGDVTPGQDTNGGTFYTSQLTLPSNTTAMFGQVTQPISEQARITAGLRVSRDKQGQDFKIFDGNHQTIESGTFRDSVNSTQYKIGYEYDLAPQSMFYSHVATGFKQGGLSPSVPPVTFKPESLTAYELGVKNRFMENRLQLNASLFYYDYKNYQISTFGIAPLGTHGQLAMFPVVMNAGAGRNKGGEFSFDWRVTSNDRVRASLVYLDATYGKVTLPNNPFVNQGDFSLEGRPMQNSPRTTANIGYEHIFDVSDGVITVGVNSKISQGYYTTPEQYLPGAWQGSYHRTDAWLNYSPSASRWTVGAWVKNIENTAQTTYVFPAFRRFVTAPRTFGVTAELKF